MREAAFCAGCAALGMFLGYVAMGLLISALSGQPGAVRLPSGREAADFAADIESWLRGEGY